MKMKSLLQLVEKLQQASNTDNLQQVCGVFRCVEEYKAIPFSIFIPTTGIIKLINNS